MFQIQKKTSGLFTMSDWLRQIPWLLIPILALAFATSSAQQLTATLSGIAADQTDARIPSAKIVVKNEATGDLRTTTADASGFFSVTALMPGTYTVTISASGFASWEQTGVLLNQGDSRTLPNIHLKIGSEATAVTVISGVDAEVPTDTAEISATLNNELVDSATLTGRNAAELIKMMPGVAFNNNGGAGGWSSTTTSTNNGPAGSFSANGTQPYGSTTVLLDGGNLIDPGNAGTQVANINQDMTDSVKYLSASYGAEYAKGPAVLSAFSKSGSQKFHGEAYVYARDSHAGFANDWNNKANGKPIYPSYFYYMGGNIGGPVILPGLKFNRNRDKLFFWGGYEYMLQHPYNQPAQMNVPTVDQRNGDFNNNGVPQGVLDNQQYAYATPCQAGTGWQGCSNASNAPWGTWSGQVPNLKQYFDPNGEKITNLNPLPNQTPSPENGWNNYSFYPNTPVNRWEATGKVTYAISDSTKLWGSYAYQSETDNHPLSIWWEPAYAIPYPGQPTGKETANVYLANLTHTFSATSTNELVFSYAKFVNANSMSNTKAVSRSALGFPQGSIFGSANQTDQIPNFFDSWAGHGSTDIRQFSFNGGIYGKNSFGKTSKAPSITDTFTKIVSTHTLKAGFYWDTQENLQSYSGWYGNGEFDVSPWGSNSTSNVVLDRLVGANANYFEQSSIPVPDELWHQWSLWAQDSWKASRKLTINVGVRADHFGQWYDKLGGTQVWVPSLYDNTNAPPANTGLSWHALNSKIPTSGWKSPLFYYDPRVGAAYDVFGNGRTVVRTGFGTFRYQVSDNSAGNAMNGPLGSFTYNTSGGVNSFYGYNVANGVVATNFAQTQTTNLTVPTSLNQTGSSNDVAADKLGDDQVPYANTYSFGVAQALPSHTVMEISYVGSMSRNQLLDGTSHLNNANPIPMGAFFGPNPNPYSSAYGEVLNPSPIGTASTLVANDYRPLHNYQNVSILTHGGYANYNSLQVSAQKQSGNLFIFTNFTFGKVLGTRDGSTANGNGNGNVTNPFKLSDNYGPLAYDHTKIFNVSFSYKLPRPIHNNGLLEGVVNGWELSGYTTYQDGSNFQASNPVMNATYCTSAPDSTTCKGPTQPDIVMPNGQHTQSIGANTWFGTTEFPNALLPILTCDPRKGTKSGQYFNPNCFAAPLPPTANSYGQQGQWVWPYFRNPHYFNSDLAVFKAFRISDAKRVEIRVSATNWLNHPNAAFGLNGTADNQLIFHGYSDGSTMVRNSNTASTTGTPQAKLGYRWMQWVAKYYF